jgi:hypothetical protein
LPRLPAVEDNAAMEIEPLKADSPKRNRRRFQYSLRTLLIGVMLLALPCAYVGSQAKIVRERREFLESHHLLIMGSLDFADHKDVSGLRKWMGDDGLDNLLLNCWTGDEELETFRRLFPEAKIVRASDLIPET